MRQTVVDSTVLSSAMSPEVNVIMPAPYSPFLIDLGFFQLRWYSVLIVTGIFVAIWLTKKQFALRGYDPELVDEFAYAAVPGGIIGARIYHVLTDLHLYRDDWTKIFRVWEGGLGIYGAIIGGAIGVWLIAHRRQVPVSVPIDSVAPGLIIAQAIGRWGNYFNQEIFGLPTDLPWGLFVDPAFRPAAFATVERFHPIFLYESLWSLGVGLLLIWLNQRHWRRWLPGTLALLYLTLYSLGRFGLEPFKVDDVLQIFNVRFNVFTSLGATLIFGLWLLLFLRRAGTRRYPVGPHQPTPA